MYAVIGRVELTRRDEALKMIKERGEAMVRGMAGSVVGYWARTLDSEIQHSLWLFDTLENARAAAAVFGKGPPPGAPATFVSLEIAEIVGNTQDPTFR
jgi:hypothetical protein